MGFLLRDKITGGYILTQNGIVILNFSECTSEHLINLIQNGGRKTMGHTKPTCIVISNSNRGKYWELNPLIEKRLVPDDSLHCI